MSNDDIPLLKTGDRVRMIFPNDSRPDVNFQFQGSTTGRFSTNGPPPFQERFAGPDLFQEWANYWGCSRREAKERLFYQMYGGAGYDPPRPPIVGVEPNDDGVYRITTMEGKSGGPEETGGGVAPHRS